MRKIRCLCTAAFLAIVFTTSAFAGDIQTPGVTSPPSQTTSATGDIQLPGASASGQMGTPLTSDADSVAEIALALMVNVLSVF
jgi:hypothetical protein